MNENDIRKSLQEELGKEKIDYDKVISLSNQLSTFDTENVRFSVDAGIVNRLGVELVGKRETAVAELIKNGYDADATQVDVIFKNTGSAGGSIIIIDNGEGMSLEQLQNGFMRLSSTVKIHNPYSNRYKRLRAGQKGIGRFAAQMLGKKLIITTQKRDAPFALKVEINWDDFSSDKDLNAIGNKIVEVSKKETAGTTLEINDLRNPWSNTIINKVYNNISTLIQPFPVSNKIKNSNDDPGFKVNFYENEIKEGNKIKTDLSNVYKYAIAEINTYVDDNSQGTGALIANILIIMMKG